MPAATPVTTPVEKFTVAIPGFDEIQNPPVAVVLSEVLRPIHITGVPVIGAGAGFTVIVFVAWQPVGNV